jgi:biotin carboxyl carrier protein
MHVELKSDMTAVVLSVEFAVGDAVAVGDEVVVLESMKMEIPVIATAAGVVDRLPFGVGETVTERDVIAVIATAD